MDQQQALLAPPLVQQPPKPRVSVERPLPDPVSEPGFRQDLFSLPEGPLIVQWPFAVSEESFQEIKDWLPILERKIKRSVKTASEGE